MADFLTKDLSMSLAESLTTIGHPRFAGAICATSEDLRRWCKGAFLNGVMWSAEAQADWLVQMARETWVDGWPDRGGTGKLYELFRSKFIPASPANTFIDYSNEPCICGSGLKFKHCCQGKSWDDDVEKLRRDLAKAEAERPKPDVDE